VPPLDDVVVPPGCVVVVVVGVRSCATTLLFCFFFPRSLPVSVLHAGDAIFAVSFTFVNVPQDGHDAVTVVVFFDAARTFDLVAAPQPESVTPPLDTATRAGDAELVKIGPLVTSNVPPGHGVGFVRAG